MPLKKPPLVEVWLSFRFEPSPSAPSWTRERYEVFLDTIASTHPDVEEMVRRGIRVSASRRGGKPRIKEVVDQILAIRAFTEDRLWAVQMTPDELSVNYLRGDDSPYPGFDALLENALAHCRQYEERYHTIGVLEAALHYVNIMEIPVSEARTIKSEDYFTLNFQVPQEAFGTFTSFDLKAVVKPPGGLDLMEVVFATEPSNPDDEQLRFRLEWHTAVRTGSRMTNDDVRANLQPAHDRLEKCFRQAFTPKGWALFDPEEP